MYPEPNKTLLLAFLLAISFKSALSINCYQCSGTDPKNPFLCNEFLETDDEDLVPLSCHDVYGANYCVKHTGRFEAMSIQCYQCDSTQSIDCADLLINEDENDFQPQECESVFEAQYCIKSTALEGGIGTRRYCSALDLGNYCNYVKQKGDSLEYRSCIFTCNTDGCNSSPSLTSSKFYSMVVLLSVMYVVRLLS
ncbi:glycosylphosphatidylinositol anchored membrane protein boudin [Arctopsyche grandis]|uniref:glycosylphosphatidylinositol anchored membrane protein boudin n=1 Tax=Arctopsyche grandis TaxID=121162 RepID=UPI00406D92AF